MPAPELAHFSIGVFPINRRRLYACGDINEDGLVDHRRDGGGWVGDCRLRMRDWRHSQECARQYAGKQLSFFHKNLLN